MARIDVIRTGSRGFRIEEQGVRLDGGETLEANLAALEEGVRKEILEAGVRTGAEVFREGAAARVADHDELAAAIAVEITEEGGLPAARIGPRRGRASNGNLLSSLGYWREFGTMAHDVVVRSLRRFSRKSRRRGGQPMGTATVLSSGTRFFGKRIRVPDVIARPFLRPTFDEDGPKAQREMGRTIWEWMRENTERPR